MRGEGRRFHEVQRDERATLTGGPVVRHDAQLAAGDLVREDDRLVSGQGAGGEAWVERKVRVSVCGT